MARASTPFPFLRRRRTPLQEPLGMTQRANSATIDRFNPTVEAGRTGTVNFNGFLTPGEYNRDLLPPQSFAVYDRMMLSDPIVKATVTHMTTPIRAAQWEVRPASDSDEHLEQAAFVEHCMFDWMEQTWDETLQALLRYLPMGCGVNEEVFNLQKVSWEYKRPGQGDPVIVPTKQMTCFKKFGERAPGSIRRWINDQNGDLAVIQQQVWDDRVNQFRTIDIPAAKCLILVNDMTGEDWWGNSILRAAYKPWMMLEGTQRVTAIGIERYYVGTPMARMNQNATPAQRTAMLQVLEEVRSAERSAIVYSAADGLDCDHEGTSGGGSSGSTRAIHILQPQNAPPDSVPYMKYLESGIFTNIMARFMDLGQKETGARATAEIQDDPFYLGLLAVATYLCDKLNRGPVKHLIDLNYPNVDHYPKIVAEKIEPIDNPIIAAAAQSYAAVGMLTPDFETEQHVRKRLGFPDKLIDQQDAMQDIMGPADEGRDYPSVLGIPAAAVKAQLVIAKMESDQATAAMKQNVANAKLAGKAAGTAQPGDIRARAPIPRTPVLRPPSPKTSDSGSGTALADAEQAVFDRLLREAVAAIDAADPRALAQLRAKDLGPLTQHYQLLNDNNDTGCKLTDASVLAAKFGVECESQVKQWALDCISENLED